MTIVFGISCYISEESQAPELKRCLESVKNYKVILVDGKWYDFRGESDLSLPSAREIIDSYPNVERIDYPNHHEWESRNKYLEACKDDEILIWLDTDEYVEHWCEFSAEGESFMIKGYDKRCGGDVLLRRGFMHPNQTRHIDRHNESFYNGHRLTFDGTSQGIIIHHDKSYRSKEREKIMYERNHLRPFR